MRKPNQATARKPKKEAGKAHANTERGNETWAIHAKILRAIQILEFPQTGPRKLHPPNPDVHTGEDKGAKWLIHDKQPIAHQMSNKQPLQRWIKHSIGRPVIQSVEKKVSKKEKEHNIP